MNLLPNFFILGAAKAGTTTLADILRQHPQVFLPFDKEPMFFSRDAFYENGIDWYCNTYFKNAVNFQSRGEASPHYLYWAEKAAARIHSVYLDQPIRFIVILRNPVDRAYSWYWNMIREGLEDLSFEQAVVEETKRLSMNRETVQSLGSMQYGYLYGGQYAAQIAHFLEYFDRHQFLFLLQDDLRQDYSQVCQQMFRFLEIDEHIKISATISNPAAMPRSRWLQRVLQGPSFVKGVIKRAAPQRIRYQAKRALLDANAVETQYPPMPAEMRVKLQNQFANENKRLAELIGRDLSSWERT
jgi:hypothetical protein